MKVNQRALHWLGSALALGGLAFVVSGLYDKFSTFPSVSSSIWLIIGALATIYALNNILLAVAWHKLLSVCGVENELKWAIKITSIFQLTKYVPGNVAHLASRQVLGQAEGYPAWALVKSSIWEFGLLALSGILYALLLAPLFFNTDEIGYVLISFLLLVFLCYSLSCRFGGGLVGDAYLLHFLFLLVSALIFFVILWVLGLPDAWRVDTMVLVVGAFVVAWLIGMVTPGAPAGIGIRETVLLFTLDGVTNQSELLFAVVFSRLVTILGDAMFFIGTAICTRKNAR